MDQLTGPARREIVMGMKFLEDNLLDHLERPEFAELRSAFNVRRHPKGSLPFQPNMDGNVVFIVASGRVRVYLAYGDKEFTLGILGKGDIYSSHTGAFVEALEDVELLEMEVCTFRSRMVGDPEVTKAMVRVLGNVLKASFSIIESLAFRDARCRIVALMASEARRHGTTTPNGTRIDLDLSMEQVGQLVGASRQTVSTLINDLIRDNLIQRTSRGQYLVPDIDELEAAVGECA